MNNDLRVERHVLHIDFLSVPQQVVNLVDIYAISRIWNYLIQESAVLFDGTSTDELADLIDVLLSQLTIKLGGVVVNQVAEHHGRSFLVRPEVTCLPLITHLETLDEVAVEHVAERTVTQVVNQTCDGDISNLSVCDAQVGLSLLKNVHLLSGKMCYTDAMLEPTMASRWKHLVAQAKLLKILQSLERRRVDNLPAIIEKQTVKSK